MMILTYYFIFLIDLIFDIIIDFGVTALKCLLQTIKEPFEILDGVVDLWILIEKQNLYEYRAELCSANC